MGIDYECAQACLDSYQPGSTWDKVWLADGVWMATRRASNGARILAFRGSENLEDWLRDLTALPALESPLGFVHAGFFAGLRDALAEWRAFAGGEPAWITGHSLGAARACLLAGLLTAMPGEVPPLGLIGFGCPRPAFAKLGRIIRLGGYPVRIYANKGDPVPDLPPAHLGFLPLPWCWRAVVKPIAVDIPTGSADPVAPHFMEYYLRAVATT